MNVLKAATLAVENVWKEGLTDIFTPPVELDLLKAKPFREQIIKDTTRCINGGGLESLAVSPIDHVLMPKGGPFDFRRCALIQPDDTIKYLALVLTIADEVERNRPAIATHRVFSYRLDPSKGYLFRKNHNITSFRKHVADCAKSKGVKYLVKCDIANFYDRLNLHRLESSLTAIGADTQRIRQINELLLHWANRDSYGLPVGSNASRILAEAALIEVDRYMQSIGAKFCRFVDDYRFFAPNVLKAHYWLTQLIERLWLEGLTINMRKTSIETASAYEEERSVDIEEHEQERTAKSKSKGGSKAESPQGSPRPQFRILAGYGGLVPTMFRVPSAAEMKKLRQIGCLAKLTRLRKESLPRPEDIVDFVKSIVASEDFAMFVHMPEVADLFPQFTPYIVDTLIKYSAEISEVDRKEIAALFAARLGSYGEVPEYLAIAIVHLLGTPPFAEKPALLTFFGNLKRNAGAYIGRALLDALEPLLTRGEVLSIRRGFARADRWEKRQIVRIVVRHLPDDEKRAWLKSVQAQEKSDPFLIAYVKATKS